MIAAFKMRGHLLLAEIEEKDEVFCPFIKQQAEREDEDQEREEEEEEDTGRMGFRWEFIYKTRLLVLSFKYKLSESPVT